MAIPLYRILLSLIAVVNSPEIILPLLLLLLYLDGKVVLLLRSNQVDIALFSRYPARRNLEPISRL